MFRCENVYCIHFGNRSESWIGPPRRDDAKTNRLGCKVMIEDITDINSGGDIARICQRVEDNAFHLSRFSEVPARGSLAVGSRNR